jgi:hypothetical protein
MVRSLRLGDLVIHYAADRYCHASAAHDVTRDATWDGTSAGTTPRKELAGKLVDNEKVEAKGKVQKIVGSAQAKFGDVKKDVKDLT